MPCLQAQLSAVSACPRPSPASSLAARQSTSAAARAAAPRRSWASWALSGRHNKKQPVVVADARGGADAGGGGDGGGYAGSEGAAHLRHLSTEQLSAVQAPLGPVRVIAGPGSGKVRRAREHLAPCCLLFNAGSESILVVATPCARPAPQTRVLASRAVELIQKKGAMPRQVLAIAFTKKVGALPSCPLSPCLRSCAAGGSLCRSCVYGCTAGSPARGPCGAWLPVLPALGSPSHSATALQAVGEMRERLEASILAEDCKDLSVCTVHRQAFVVEAVASRVL